MTGRSDYRRTLQRSAPSPPTRRNGERVPREQRMWYGRVEVGVQWSYTSDTKDRVTPKRHVN